MKNIHVAAAVALALSSVSFAQQAVQWKVSEGGNGHWYRLVSTQTVSWASAASAAGVAGGHLATLTASPENNFVVASFQGFPSRYPWIGLIQDPNGSEPAGGWGWVTNEPLTWANWSPSEPNGDFPFDADQANLWLVAESGRPLGTWNDWTTGGPDGYVIEWSADCNGDGIVDYGQCRDGSLADYNGNNIPDCCEAGTPCVAGNYPVQWRTTEGGNGHWYQLVRTEAGAQHWTWSAAASAASSRGAHLVTFGSESESSAVYSCLGLAGATDCVAWIGFLQDPGSTEPNGGWRWITREPIVFLNWKPGYPDDAGCSIQGNHQDFAVIGSGGDPRWDDTGDPSPNCPYGVPFAVIEWDADCNNDGLVDKGQILRGQLADTDNDGVPNVCECVCDVFRDFNVNGIDLGILLGQWGPSSQFTVTDFNQDGSVDGFDLGVLLGAWGPCPN